MASDESKKRDRDDSTLPSSSSEGALSSEKRIKTLTGWLGMTDSTRVSIGIIGTAGRGRAADKMSLELFDAMVKSAVHIIEEVWRIPWSQVDLVSGGAAWADHVAVSLFLQNHAEGTKLELFLPCPLDLTNLQFEDSGIKDWQKNPGRTANIYHTKFSKALGYNSIADMQKSTSYGAKLNTDFFGFKERNAQVAKVENLLAFTWSRDEPEDGGTKHTWSLSKGKRLHISLDSLGPSQPPIEL